MVSDSASVFERLALFIRASNHLRPRSPVIEGHSCGDEIFAGVSVGGWGGNAVRKSDLPNLVGELAPALVKP